jgi:hypothetical protein
MSLPEWVMVVAGDVDRAVLPEWNRWYDEEHLGEIVGCPGFLRATRYVGDEDETEFVTIYELESAEAFRSEEFQAARGLGPFGDNVRVKTRLLRRHLAVEA